MKKDRSAPNRLKKQLAGSVTCPLIARDSNAGNLIGTSTLGNQNNFRESDPWTRNAFPYALCASVRGRRRRKTRIQHCAPPLLQPRLLRTVHLSPSLFPRPSAPLSWHRGCESAPNRTKFYYTWSHRLIPTLGNFLLFSFLFFPSPLLLRLYNAFPSYKKKHPRAEIVCVRDSIKASNRKHRFNRCRR